MFSKAAQLVLKHHRDQGHKPSYAGHLVGQFPELPSDEVLLEAYAELTEAGELQPADGAIGHGLSREGQHHFRTLYRLRS